MRKLFFMLGIILLLTACSKAKVVEHVEAFTSETMSDTPERSGFYVETGYKRVNSVSLLKEWDDKFQGEISSIEDFYDLNGDYINTVVTYSYSKEMKRHNMLDDKKEQVELTKPTTILTPDVLPTVIETKILSEEEKEVIKSHVLKHVDEMR